MTQQRDVLVIGAGVIGVCSAYYLQKAGRRVTIVERDEVCSGSSHGNAGWIVPSHSVPLAAPGAVLRGLRWMFNPESPFYIKPRFDLDLLRWLLRFRAAANEGAVRRSLPVLRELSNASLALYEELVADEALDCKYRQVGLMALYRTERAYEDGIEDAHVLEAFGIPTRVHSSSEVVDMAPAVRSDIVGGIFFDGDAHVKPDDFVNGLASRFQEQGGEILTGAEVQGFEVAGGRVESVKTSRGDYRPEQVVLAAGAWSPGVARDLKLKLPVQPAKGYSVTFDAPEDLLPFPMMLAGARVGVTPMGPRIRLAGTLELSGINLDINQRRIAAIRRAPGNFLTLDFERTNEEVWCGMRPLSADGRPIIGVPGGVSNLIVATGHSMTGVTQGPATGKLVSEIAMGQAPTVDPTAFSPRRFE